MSKLTEEKREQLIFCFSAAVSVLSTLIVLVLVGFQVYVRWFLNQNFTLLGGSELEALTVSAFALMIALTYVHRPSNK